MTNNLPCVPCSSLKIYCNRIYNHCLSYIVNSTEQSVLDYNIITLCWHNLHHYLSFIWMSPGNCKNNYQCTNAMLKLQVTSLSCHLRLVCKYYHRIYSTSYCTPQVYNAWPHVNSCMTSPSLPWIGESKLIIKIP